MFKGILKPYQPEAVDKMVTRKRMLVAYEMGLGKTCMTIAALEKLKENGELNKPILARVQKAVEIVSDRKKINYVLDESSTLYFKGGMDITAEVLVELLILDVAAMKK